jgi:hypothetical protein
MTSGHPDQTGLHCGTDLIEVTREELTLLNPVSQTGHHCGGLMNLIGKRPKGSLRSLRPGTIAAG